MVAVHANNADKLVNKVFNEIMEILVQVIDEFITRANNPLAAEEILLLKKPGCV